MWHDFAIYAAIGFIGHFADSVPSSAILLSMGLPPAAVSACAHTAEVMTNAAAGFSHWKFGNVDMSIVRRLAVPGAIGGGIGAYLLSNINGDAVRPYVAAYLLLVGLYIVWRALRHRPKPAEPPRHIAPLGLAGGFLDSIGGSGWGPMVTTTLIGSGTTPRYAIGSVVFAEMAVTLTISLTFLLTIGLAHWPVILGLTIGGILAAPITAYAAKHIPTQTLSVIVGSLVCLLSLKTIFDALF